jgi:lysine 2,3-aminomutase
MHQSQNETEALIGVKNWVLETLEERPDALAYYRNEATGRDAFEKLSWKDFAAIRLLDYVDYAGQTFPDQNLRGEIAVSNPIKLVWLAVRFGTGGAKPFFFKDMLELFRQFSGASPRTMPTRSDIESWMDRFPSGLDPRIIALREENRKRILNVIIDMIDSGKKNDSRYKFDKGMTQEEKFDRALTWWDDHVFHLRFAARDPDTLNDMLGKSLDPDTMKVLYDATAAGIPIFVNPYYISLINVRVPYFAIGSDLAIRDYVIYSRHLVEEFGHISAWEKEDQVEPGKPNAAGWLLPSHRNVHRRYPDVAILIPNTRGRACGGLCASCQRMYDFQNGHLQFDLDTLAPRETWTERLKKLMCYFEEDSQLRDILITGGDGLMSTDHSLAQILDAVLEMAKKKVAANKRRKPGKKYAELVRVRIGTRLPVYLPQRITSSLTDFLKDFKEKASQVGVKQFIIQTHFESPMEMTVSAMEGIERLNEAGWTVTNQHVFTTASSRRGHTAKLRQVLNDAGVLPYYTFSVKGYMENYHSFATNARAMQEQIEEKSFGNLPEGMAEEVSRIPFDATTSRQQITAIRKAAGVPFLATDRNILNLPGVGKSLSYRVIGITRYGRRILEFEHDTNRNHSPIIEKINKVVIVESKSIAEYLDQLESMGEDIDEYRTLFGYSIGETELRLPVYEYPEYDFDITDEMTNLQI